MSILNKLTLAQLKENKSRTFLTGLSISMIVALLTAIAIFLTSAWSFMFQAITDTYGDWHFETALVSPSQAKDLSLAKFVESTHEVPSSPVTLESDNEALNGTQLNTFTVQGNEAYVRSLGYMVRGTAPSASDEIALPSGMITPGEVDTSKLVGTSVTLTNGSSSKTYKVVGVIATDDKNTYALTYTNDFPTTSVIVYGKSKVLNGDYYKTLDDYSKASGVSFVDNNSNLLSLYLVTRNEFIESMIKIILPVVLGLVALISITVISSSFMLSLNERLKQLGALSSIGTTRGQLVKMMLMESAWIGGFAILAGLAIGYVGTAISLHYFDGFAQNLVNGVNSQAHFNTILFWPAILAVVVLAMIIIALSSIIPSFRAAKRAPIDNIKQVPFRKLFKFGRKTQTSRRNFLSKIFGQPAYLAKRYQKHNSSRSRLVFAVLTISLLTFNVVSTTMLQLTDSINGLASAGYSQNIYTTSDYVVNQYGQLEDQGLVTTIKDIPQVERVYAEDFTQMDASNNKALLDYNDFSDDKKGIEKVSLPVIRLAKEEEAQVLKAAGLSQEDFDKGQAILITADFAYGKLHKDAIPTGQLKGQSLTLEAYQSGKTSTVTLANNIKANQVNNLSWPSNNVLVVSDQQFKSLTEGLSTALYRIISVKAKENAKEAIQADLTKVVDQAALPASLGDIVAQRRQITSVLAMFQIVAYGFLGLISVICLTTFFNTIVANTRMRRREFAVLQSVGMTRKQLRTMLSIENLKTGIWSLVISTVLSAIILTLMNTSISGGSAGSSAVFGISWVLVAGSSLVFLTILVLFNTFSLRQALQRSIVEDIKDETL